MYDINKIFNKGLSITSDLVCDSYTNMAYDRKLEYYRFYNRESLLHENRLTGTFPTYLYDFILRCGNVVGTACITFGTIHYMVFRSIDTKKFITVSNCRNIPYGIWDFTNFKYGEYIILVEGLKDRDALASIYPYTLALQTASLSSYYIDILRTLTNKVALLYDNPLVDNTSKDSIIKDTGNLWKLGFTVKNLYNSNMKHPDNEKDSGGLYDTLYRGDIFRYNYLKNYYTLIVKEICNGFSRNL